MSLLNAGKEPPIFYYRDKDQKQIDLLIQSDGFLYPIEIKKSGSPGKDSTKHFKILSPLSVSKKASEFSSITMEIGTGIVVCMSNDLIPIDENNWYVPVWMI